MKRHKGDDGGCFAAALWAVRTFGGVIEHPEASWAWEWHGIRKPPKSGGWVSGDRWGVTCCVEQGHYGHRARKATWLYAVACQTVELRWGPSSGDRIDAGYHSAAERAAARDRPERDRGRLTAEERIATPPAFRDMLIGLARGAR